MPATSNDQRVVRLPGIGTRLELRDTSGDPLHVVRRLDGHLELHLDHHSVIEFDTTAARTLGAFASGHFVLAPELDDRLGDVLGGLLFDWIHLDATSDAVGQSIAELAVRSRTGATIVAILRGSVPIVAPEPSMVLEAGDDLVIACRVQDRDTFAEYVSGDR